MKEVLPGIYQINLSLSGFNPDSVNVYLLRDGDGYLLIDTGWDLPPAVQSMENQLAESGLHLTDIKRVVVTHAHIDHMGLIGRLKKSHNAKIYLHQKDIELANIRFSGGDNYIPMTDTYLQSHGVPLAELARPEFELPNVVSLIPPDVLLHGGEEIPAGEYALKVIHTPGHTPGHISLYESRKKFLFSGDLLLPTIATNAAFHVQHMINPLQQYLNSLGRLKEMDIDLVIPGHEYIFRGHRKRIDELVQHHRQKADEIEKAFIDGQPKNAYEVSKIISWSPKNRTSRWNSLTGWDKRFAMLQTIAHLEEMAGAGKLTRFYRGGTLYYR